MNRRYPFLSSIKNCNVQNFHQSCNRSQQVFQLKMRNARVSLRRNEYYLKNINARDAQVSDLTIISAGLRPVQIYKTPPIKNIY